MASPKNDALRERTVEGSINYYTNQKCKGTAGDKGIASRLGGQTYNIISNSERDEVYLRHLRKSEHFVDERGRHTEHFFGSRRRKYGGDERSVVAETMTQPVPHPREQALEQRRLERSLAQIENWRSYAGFQERCEKTFGHAAPPRRQDIDNARYANESEPVLQPRVTPKAEWKARRGEVMTRSISAPSISVADPAASLANALREDIRKEASQRQVESAHFAPRMSYNTYTTSVDASPFGQQYAADQRHCSINRVENYDFSVARKNNHHSAEDKLTRADPFYLRPRLGVTNNSVKYDIISNERRWFKY